MRRAQATQLRDGLRTLRLATIRECYREQADLARKETLPYEAYLLELVNHECETRAHNRVQRLLRESRPRIVIKTTRGRSTLPDRTSRYTPKIQPKARGDQDECESCWRSPAEARGSRRVSPVHGEYAPVLGESPARASRENR